MRLPALLLAAGALAACAGPRTTSAVAPLPGCTSDTVRLATPTGTLVGSLACPVAPLRAPVPIVLLHSGSGPTDRDGNSALAAGPNDGLRMLADSLARRGVASLRYDKRGVGASRGAARAESELRFDTYVDDAAAWIRYLQADRRFDRIVVAGHSEGSLIGMLATRAAGADGFVSLAGPGRSAGDVLRAQLAPRLPAPLLAETERIVAALEAGRTVDSVPPALLQLFRPSVQPYLASWFRHDPAAELARLDVPVLVVQGTTDTQVSVEDARRLARARPGLEPVILEGVNHVLKVVPAETNAQLRSYWDPTLPVPTALVDAVHAFVVSVPARAR